MIKLKVLLEFRTSKIARIINRKLLEESGILSESNDKLKMLKLFFSRRRAAFFSHRHHLGFESPRQQIVHPFQLQ